MRVTISVDDVHPEVGWGMPEDQCMEYLSELNKEFGAKFTLFIPSNYHRKFPLREHKEWVKWLKSVPYFELAAHGHYHDTTDPAHYGECEFAEINNWLDALERLKLLKDEWVSVGHIPDGWRSPGWLCHPANVNPISDMFAYVALHYEHNRRLQWDCIKFFGHDGIHTTDISVHNGDMIMFQSHIAGDWNDNRWNDTNYQQMRLSLRHLIDEYPGTTFHTLNDC